MGKYLGIDYGLKRIGIAVSDENNKYSFSRDYILNDDKTLNKIISLIKDESVSIVVLGYPINFKSEKTHSTNHVEIFRKKLEEEINKYLLNTTVEYFDERFTSNLAQYHLGTSGLKKEKRKEKGLLDSISAQIILQDYIDSKSK